MNKKNSIAWPIAICADSDIADKIEAIYFTSTCFCQTITKTHILKLGYWYPGKNTITLVETLT